jgi:2'-5' RNA ligase
MQPLYLMLKPPSRIRRDIDHWRSMIGIDDSYSPERFHITVLPLRDGRDAPPNFATLLIKAISSLAAEPFSVTFEQLDRNVLIGRRAMRPLRDFQRRLVQRLTAFGIAVPTYKFRPHLSLAYGPAPERRLSIPPITWHVDEILLIRSIHGQGRHVEEARFPLMQRQGSFGF